MPRIEETDPAPRIDKVIKSAVTRKALSAACAEYREIQERMSEDEKRKKELLADVIRPLADKAKITRVAGDGWTLVRCKGRRSDIKAELLLAKGVSMDTINKCTMTNTWEYFQVLSDNT